MINMKTDKEKILNLVKAYQDAIHSQKKEDFLPLWTGEDNNVLISIASQFSGLEKIYNDFLIGGIQYHYTEIRLIAEDIEIHFISNDIATVIFQYHTECIRRETGEEYGIAGVETQIVKKVNDEWKLVHIHYSKK